MCARFSLFSGSNVITTLFDLDEPADWEPSYNIAPTEDAPVILLNKEGNRVFEAMRWGLVPHWSADSSGGVRMINARSESVAAKPAFQDSFRRRRCLIAVDGFFEWKTTGKIKQPYLFARADRKPFGLAGIWDRWRSDGAELRTCSILTTEANALVAQLHDRMPVILDSTDFHAWLDPTLGAEAAQTFLAPDDDEQMVAFPVTARMGNPRYKEADAVLPDAPMTLF
jgi:putative SOS response-associated peptidase YedK